MPESPEANVDLRSYRLARAATGESTQLHGGAVPFGMTVIVTAVDRVDSAYEIDAAIHGSLVASTAS